MDRFRSASLQVGVAMGLIFVIVGLVLDNHGIVGLGIVVGLAGFVTRTGYPK